MNRWTVRKVDSYWTTGWEVLNRDLEFGGIFTKWEEALDYADQQARTVAVTLPRSPKLVPNPTLMPKHLAVVYNELSTGPAWWLNGTVHAHELHDLAIALLALAARNGVNQ